jgi:hypothetical protein
MAFDQNNVFFHHENAFLLRILIKQAVESPKIMPNNQSTMAM